MKKRLILTTFFIVGCLFAEESYDLKYNVEKGQKYDYLIKMDNQFDIASKDFSRKGKLNFSVNNTQTIKDIDQNNDIEFASKLTSISAELLSDEINISCTVSEGEQHQLSISETENNEVIQEQIDKFLPEIRKALFQETSLKMTPKGEFYHSHSLNYMNLGFPVDKIKVGESWDLDMPVLPADVSFKVRMTLMEKNDREFIVKVSPEIDFSAKEIKDKEISVTGQVHYDAKTLMVTKGFYDYHIKITGGDDDSQKDAKVQIDGKLTIDQI